MHRSKVRELISVPNFLIDDIIGGDEQLSGMVSPGAFAVLRGFALRRRRLGGTRPRRLLGQATVMTGSFPMT